MTCDGPSAKAGKHLCGHVMFPDEAPKARSRLVTVNQVDGGLLPSPNLTVAEQRRVEQAIVNLKLDDPGLKRRRLNLIGEIEDHHQQGRTRDQIRYDLLRRGFTSTVRDTIYRL